MMALAAALVTVWTAYVGLLFAKRKVQGLQDSYLWGIRLGIFIFVIFSFEGFLMGSRMSHTVGAPDGSEGIWFLNWSKTFGDLRVSHFLGMHALQLIPILGFYVLKTRIGVVVCSLLYFALTTWVLAVTLMGKSIL